MVSCDGITSLDPIYHVVNQVLRFLHAVLIATYFISFSVTLVKRHSSNRQTTKWPSFLKWLWVLIPIALTMLVVEDILFAIYNSQSDSHTFSDMFSFWLDAIQ